MPSFICTADIKSLIIDTMDLRIWNFKEDSKYIPDFLMGMSLAHKEPPKDEKWFHWKFEQSPYGPAILASAFDGEKVAGCVAYGIGFFDFRGITYKCALSYETFVHPEYQGKGLFKKLITLAEAEMIEQKVDLAYNFPNSNSLPGFIRMGWTQYNDLKQFKVKICHFFHVFSHLTDLRKVFIPNPSNIDILPQIISSDVTGKSHTFNDGVYMPIWNADYLRWRFLTYPNREYCIQDNNFYFCISMIGYRGRLRVAEILYLEGKNGNKTQNVAKLAIKELKKKISPDIIAYSTTDADNSIDNVFGFIKVPTHANFCYKYFNKNIVLDKFRMLLPSINAHTY